MFSCEIRILLSRFSRDISDFHWPKLIYMAILMTEDKSRYNDMNTIIYETDASKP